MDKQSLYKKSFTFCLIKEIATIEKQLSKM